MDRSYRSFSVRRAGALGAEISGLDLRETLSEETFGELSHALAANEVLFFRDQPLDGDQQLDIAKRFGEISLYPIEKFFGAEEPGHQVVVDDAENAPGVDATERKLKTATALSKRRRAPRLEQGPRS